MCTGWKNRLQFCKNIWRHHKPYSVSIIKRVCLWPHWRKCVGECTWQINKIIGPNLNHSLHVPDSHPDLFTRVRADNTLTNYISEGNTKLGVWRPGLYYASSWIIVLAQGVIHLPLNRSLIGTPFRDSTSQKYLKQSSNITINHSIVVTL